MIRKPNNLKVFWSRKIKGLNRKTKIGHGYQYPREIALSFNQLQCLGNVNFKHIYIYMYSKACQWYMSHDRKPIQNYGSHIDLSILSFDLWPSDCWRTIFWSFFSSFAHYPWTSCIHWPKPGSVYCIGTHTRFEEIITYYWYQAWMG